MPEPVFNIASLTGYPSGLYVDLYGGALQVHENWVPSYGGGVGASERIPVYAAGSSAAVKAELAKLDLLFKQAREYPNDRFNHEPVVLVWIHDDGTVQVAQVLDGIAPQMFDVGVDPWLTTASTHIQLTIEVERSAIWEDRTSATFGDQTNMNSLGGVYQFSSVAGTETARLSRIDFDGSGTGDIAHMWAGIRDERMGLTDFDPLLEAEDGTLVSADSSVETSDSGTGGKSGTGVVETTFSADATLVERFRVGFYEGLTAPDEDMSGEYLVLGRVRVTAGSTRVGIQLRTGYDIATENVLIRHEVLEITREAWHMQPMGYIKVPSFSIPDDGTWNDDWVADFHLSLWAERLSGTGYLRVDCFVLIPTDHYFVGTNLGIGFTETLSIHTRMDGINVLAPTTLRAPTAVFNDWGLPPGNSKIVIVTERLLAQYVADDVDMQSITYKPRTRGVIE